MAKRRMMVQIIPRVILTLPSTISIGKKKGREEIEDIKLQLQILVKQEHWGVFPFADERNGIPAKNCFSLPSRMLC